MVKRKKSNKKRKTPSSPLAKICLGPDNNGRFFFSPSRVSEEISNGSRSCVKACLDHMGFMGNMKDISPVVLRNNKIVQWSKVLESVCPGAVIQPFKTLANLPCDTSVSDGLIVAEVNKRQGTADHAMVVWKKDKTQLGNKKLELFNPGTLSGRTIRTVDLSNERTTAGWDRCCAAFLPGTVFEKDVDPVPVYVENDNPRTEHQL